MEIIYFIVHDLNQPFGLSIIGDVIMCSRNGLNPLNYPSFHKQAYYHTSDYPLFSQDDLDFSEKNSCTHKQLVKLN